MTSNGFLKNDNFCKVLTALKADSSRTQEKYSPANVQVPLKEQSTHGSWLY